VYLLHCEFFEFGEFSEFDHLRAHEEKTMAKGRTYNHERIARTDPETGRKMLQLTSFPTISSHLPYYYTSTYNGFTADSRTLVFRSQRSGERAAPFDLFRVDVDGANLTQLTERDRIGGIALAPTKPLVYFYIEGSLWSVNLETFAEEEIAHEDIGKPNWKGREPGDNVAWGYVSPDDRWYFIPSMNEAGEPIILRHATDGSDVRVIHTGADVVLQYVDPQGRGLMVMVREGGRRRFALVDFEGRVIGRYGWNVFAHGSPLGRSGLYQGCGMPPLHAILTMQEGQDDALPLVEGPYFWHSSASLDGEWIVADTNFPNEGLQLVCVRTRRFRTFLHPHNSAGHPQRTHAHPFFSPDRRYVAFNSDWTGTGQVYVAEVPQELYDELGA